MAWIDEEVQVGLTRKQVRFLIMIIHVMRAVDTLKGTATYMELMQETEKALAAHAD